MQLLERPEFAMTINQAQGQTLQRVVMLLNLAYTFNGIFGFCAEPQ